MTTALIVVLGVVMLVAAVFAVLHQQLVSAVIAAGVVSLSASVVYVLLAAPDVAMTEAAIGSALTTVVFLYALSRIRGAKGGSDGS
ncbi:MAG: Na(+)/H(+) antiporter subunit B [Spirochaetota bacterium]